MPTLTIPNTFSNGTAADATAVNANFSAVSTLLNSTLLDSTNIQASGIASSNIASNAVTTAKIADANVTSAKLASSVQTLVNGIVVRYTDTSGAAIGTSDAVFKYQTSVIDTNTAYSTSTGLFTAPSAGKYRVTAKLVTAAVSLTTSQGLNMYIYKNGSKYSEIGQVFGNGTSTNYRLTGSDIVSCAANDTIGIYAISSSATTASNTGANQANYITIELIGS